MADIGGLTRQGNGLYWTIEKDCLLKKLVRKLQKGGGRIDWNFVGDKISRKPALCKERWETYLSPIIRKGAWSSSEDRMLMDCSRRMGSLSIQSVTDEFNRCYDSPKFRSVDQCQRRLYHLTYMLIKSEAQQKDQVRSTAKKENPEVVAAPEKGHNEGENALEALRSFYADVGD